jgi:hypothetical protein
MYDCSDLTSFIPRDTELTICPLEDAGGSVGKLSELLLHD